MLCEVDYVSCANVEGERACKWMVRELNQGTHLQ